ncbi:MAG: microcin C transport system substrate-binding protein [Halieaceae bacterium]|jgi:microcin C transport system substrate-binding protein
MSLSSSVLRLLMFVAVLITTLGLCGCGDESPSTENQDSSAPASLAGVNNYYAANPDFFLFKSLDDLPTDLTWQDGQDQPELGSPDAKKGGTWHAYMADFPRTTRWFGPDANSHFRRYLLDDTMMYLGRVHPETKEIYSGLAQEWAVAREESTLYIRLRPDARWSDGNPVTSDDYLYALYFYKSEHIHSPWMNNFYSSLFAKITRYDDLTFSITTRAAKPDFAGWIMNMAPIPHSFFGELDENFVQNFQWTPWPTTGPYEVREGDLVKGRSITLTRIQDWWAKDLKYYRYRFNPDRVHLQVIRDRAKALETFRRGELDEIGINRASDWYEKFPDTEPLISLGYVKKIQFYNQHPFSIDGLYLNVQRAPLDNLDVRLGVQFASNWQLIIDKLYRGDYRRVNSWADGYGPFTHPTIKARPYNLVRAREYFAKAGYDQIGPDGILRTRAGKRLSFNVSYSANSNEDLLTLLQQEALKAGMELRLEKLDATASWKKVQEKKHQIQYTGFSNFLEMYPRFWEGAHSSNAYDKPYLADGTINPDRKPKPQTNNYEGIALPEMDRLIEAYDLSESKQEMIGLSHQMYQLLHDYAAFVPGAARDYYRVAHWRWVKYPEDFNVKYSNSADQTWLHWIDEDIKAATQAAREDGTSLPPDIKIYDQYRRH